MEKFTVRPAADYEGQPGPEIVVMGGGSSRFRVLAIGVGLLIIFVGIVFGLLAVRNTLQKRTNDSKVTESYADAQLSYEESVNGVAKTQSPSRAINTNKDFTKYYGQAVDSLEAHEYDKAVMLFEKADEAPGTKPSDFYVQMAAAYYGAGNSKKAVVSLQKAKDVYVAYETKGVSTTTQKNTLEGYDMLLEEYER